MNIMNRAQQAFNPIKQTLRDKLKAAMAEVIAPEAERVIGAVRDLEMRSRRDIVAAGEREATSSSARLVRREMARAQFLPNPRATLECGLSLAPKEGLALEFGVYSGSTLRVIAEHRQSGGVFGFDSFEGLPEDWRAGFPAGTFGGSMLAGIPEVPGAELLIGWFHDTLPAFLAEHPEPVAFLHLDADLYSSTKTVLELVGPRLFPGSVIVFDEFFNYPGWQDGEYRAWQEFVALNGWQFCYEACTVDNEQVVVRLGNRTLPPVAADALSVHATGLTEAASS